MSYENSSEYLAEIISEFGQADFSPSHWIEQLKAISLNQSEESFCQEFYAVKAQFDLAWAGVRFEGRFGGDQAHYMAMGKWRSEFAAESIDKALEFAWQDILRSNRIAEVALEGLFILGLGKLGGRDLNFSSDVDIIAYYDPEVFPISENKGQKYIAGKVLQKMSQILEPRSGRFMWRVDWRLRPEASTQGLAMSTGAALSFYQFRALPWHRLALLKARVVAGDTATGLEFLDQLRPFIWRRNLDFKAIEEIGHLKRRINLEHPSLRIERARPEPIGLDGRGFNVKLGRGGIREIEFIANALQLIWGGKKYLLRTAQTLRALKGLIELELIEADQGAMLIENYQIFRRLEDAIQMVGNQQTHIVPDGGDLDKVARLLGVEWDEFAEEIYTRRQAVNAQFEELFKQSGDEDSETDISIDDISSDKARDIAESWLGGFDAHGLRPEDLPRFQALGRESLSYVLSAAQQSGDAPDEALGRIDRFLRRISRSDQYFRLLERNPEIFKSLIDPLLYSPHMTVLLEQSPHIIDSFLDPTSPINAGPFAPLDPSFIFNGEDYEIRLERLRRFVNENLFAYYHLFIQGEGDKLMRAKDVQAALTELARLSLMAAIRIVAEELNLEALPMAVLGMGKMGSGHMAPMSDLDLVFIFDDDTDPQLSAQIVRRLRTTLTTPLREGIAYELDMRLRPSGRSGPAAVKFSSFEEYQNTRAKTWEHIALCSAKAVVGDPDLCARVDAQVANIITRPRDRAQCLADAKIMWSRLKDQRITQVDPYQLNSKLGEGGLMQAEYMRSVSRLISKPCESLDAPIDFWRRLQIWERLFALTGKTISDTPAGYLARLTLGDAKQFSAQSQTHREQVISMTEKLFEGVEINPNEREEPVIWED